MFQCMWIVFQWQTANHQKMGSFFREDTSGYMGHGFNSKLLNYYQRESNISIYNGISLEIISIIWNGLKWVKFYCTPRWSKWTSPHKQASTENWIPKRVCLPTEHNSRKAMDWSVAQPCRSHQKRLEKPESYQKVMNLFSYVFPSGGLL